MLSHFILRNLLSTILLCLFFSCISIASSIDTARWEEGRSLFKANCASCHNTAIAQTGPALTGVTARWDAAGDFGGKTGKQWLYAWIRNWKDPVDAQYPYAVKVQNYSASQMSIFPSLSDNDIASILVYVENPHAIIAIADHKSEKGAGWSNIILCVLGGLVAISLAVLFMIGRKSKHVG